MIIYFSYWVHEYHVDVGLCKTHESSTPFPAYWPCVHIKRRANYILGQGYVSCPAGTDIYTDRRTGTIDKTYTKPVLIVRAWVDFILIS